MRCFRQMFVLRVVERILSVAIFGFAVCFSAVAQEGTRPPAARFPLNASESLGRFDFWDNQDAKWFEQNIPLLDTPDAALDEIWYYRWELVTKHLVYGSPNDGWASTEFIDRPFWSGTYGAISCPAGLQLQELRWLRDPQIARDYRRYWLRTPGAQPRRYSTWLADACWKIHQVHPNDPAIIDLLDDLIANYRGWEAERFDAEVGLFWQIGHDDGMETNINSRQTPDWFRGAPAYRPTLNAYLWADALAIAQIARLSGRDELAEEFVGKAEQLKSQMQKLLWDPKREFFFPMSMRDEELNGFVVKKGSLTHQSGQFAGSPYGRELIGYVPWQFEMLDSGFESAWKPLLDDQGFRAPFGPTTTERRDPLFLISPNCCVWSGQSWPYATSQTLQALANVVQQGDQKVVDAADYRELLATYVATHHKLDRPYIAEAAHPDTGSWDGHDTPNHSENYFHSSFCDLVLTGLLGIRPTDQDRLILKPLVDPTWDRFAVQDVPYHGRRLSLVWDRTGEYYRVGTGLTVWCDGEVLHRAQTLQPLDIEWPARVEVADAGLQPTRWVNVAVNNHGVYYPRVRANSTAPGSSTAMLIDGQAWYLEFPRNGWISNLAEGEDDQLEIDLGIARRVSRLTLHPHSNATHLRAPTHIKFEAWINDEWKVLIDRGPSEAELPWSRREVRFDSVSEGSWDSPIEASRFRLTLKREPGFAVGLAELGLWGDHELPLSEAPLPTDNLALRSEGSDYPQATASHTSRFDQVEMINDGVVSFRPGPHNRWTAYESTESTDWLQLEWDHELLVGRVEVGLYDDRGGVQPPASFQIEYLVDGQWSEVTELSRLPAKPQGGEFNEVVFEPVKTTTIRVVFEHQGASRAGVTEIFVREK